MSNAQTRQDIADALSTVDGIIGHPAKPSALNDGDAWPQWGGNQVVSNGGLYENTWTVIVILPQADDITADDFVDSKGYEIAEALSPHLFVETMRPANAGSDASPRYALLLTGRSE